MGIRGQYRNKRDGNEPEIVRTFEALGVSVTRMDTPVDLLCGFRGQTYAVEVKQPGKGMNDKQESWLEGWRGDLTIVWTVQDVRDVVADWRSAHGE